MMYIYLFFVSTYCPSFLVQNMLISITDAISIISFKI